MRNNTALNMTEGKPLVLLSMFALPLLIGNLFQQACNLADSMIVGRLLGADALPMESRGFAFRIWTACSVFVRIYTSSS